MNETQQQIINDIISERNSQDAKWGVQNHVPSFWYLILGEEFGEVGKAILEQNQSNLREELIQLSASAIAFAECLDNNSQDENDLPVRYNYSYETNWGCVVVACMAIISFALLMVICTKVN